MSLFPILRGDAFSVPLPPTCFGWVARLYADEREANADWLGQHLTDAPWLATWLTCRSAGAQPDSLAALASQLAAELPGLLADHVDVAEVSDQQLDAWAESHRRLSWVAAEYRDASEQDRLGVLFSEGEVWLFGAENDSSSEPPAWLSKLRATLDDESAVDASLERLREIRRRWTAESPSAQDRVFQRHPKEVVLDFVQSVERMAARYRRLGELEQRFQTAVEREKLEALKELAYGASHEINNPLANIATRAQTLIRDEADGERRRSLATINAQAFRAHEMISDMMLFARPPRLDAKATDLVELAQQVIAEVADEAETQETKIQLCGGDRLLAEVDSTHLAAALRAIIRNALEALVEGGAVQVQLRGEEDAEIPSGQVAIEVSDNGPGIPEAIRPRIFDPYFSGREAGRGLGLGLSKAWTVVREHGGELIVEQRGGGESQGVTMRMLLPQRAVAAKTASPETTPDAGRTSSA